MGNFWPSQPLQKWFFDMGDNFEGPIKSAQGENFEKKFFRNLSKNFQSFQKYILGILRPRSRSEIDFLGKKSEKVANTGNPPPFSYLRDITHVAKRGGPCVWTIFGLFFS